MQQNHDGQTPLQIALQFQEEKAELLLARGVHVRLEDFGSKKSAHKYSSPTIRSESGLKLELLTRSIEILKSFLIGENFLNFFMKQQEEFSDITITAGNKNFCCHTVFLARSDKLLEQIQNNSREICMPYEPEVVVKMLEFLYSDEVKLLMDTKELLADLASQYGIPRLQAICENR